MEISEKVLNEWYGAVRMANEHFCNKGIEEFRLNYPLEYRHISSFFRLRTVLKGDIDALSYLGEVKWFTLTYNEEKDKNKENTKRKNAFKFLNSVFVAFLLVEEHGEEKGRYHVHGFGVFKDSNSFESFRKWHSGQNIKTLNGNELFKKVKYLTKYAVKQLPRVRRSKTLIAYEKLFKSMKWARKDFKRCFECRIRLLKLKTFGARMVLQESQ